MLQVDIRDPFHQRWEIRKFDQLISEARIEDTKQPFEKQPENRGESLLYDGFELQKSMREFISDTESGWDQIHIVLTDLLTCTFDEDDWRYHARTIICGTPSFISLSGIVEGPARPKEYYYLARLPLSQHLQVERQFSDKFMTYGDNRISSAVLLYIIQVIFYFASKGEPFCEKKECILYNAHWQEELLQLIQKPAFIPNI